MAQWVKERSDLVKRIFRLQFQRLKREGWNDFDKSIVNCGVIR
jgi:hypothetical protein